MKTLLKSLKKQFYFLNIYCSMKTFEQFNAEDPYDEEKWGDDELVQDLELGYSRIRMLLPTQVDLTYNQYDDNDEPIEDHRDEWNLVEGEELCIDIISQDDYFVDFTADTGDDYVAQGSLPKKSFVVI